MNTLFLKEISEAYVIDRNLELDSNEVYNELYELITYIREVDYDLYDELYNLSKVRQQRILFNYLDPESDIKEDNLYEDAGLTALFASSLGMTLLLIVFLLRKGISKFIFSTLSKIGSVFSALGDFLSKHGRYLKLRYAIIRENFQKCYKQCGIRDFREISSLAYVSIKANSTTFATAKSAAQARCLRDCYLGTLIDTICLYMESYFACIRRTGGYDALKNVKPDEISNVVSSVPLTSACQIYYKLGKEVFENFHRTLEFVYGEVGSDEKDLQYMHSWLNLLRKQLYIVKEYVLRQSENELKRYDPAHPAGEGDKSVSPAPNK